MLFKKVVSYSDSRVIAVLFFSLLSPAVSRIDDRNMSGLIEHPTSISEEDKYPLEEGYSRCHSDHLKRAHTLLVDSS